MIATFSVIFAAIVVVFITYVSYRMGSFWRNIRYIGLSADQLPGEPKHWLWGTVDRFPGPNEEGLEFLRKMMVKYPLVQRNWLLFYPTVMVYHYETMRDLFRSSEPKSTKFGAYALGRDWIGDGLLLSGGKKWARNRRLLTPAFHFDILKPYIKIKNDSITHLLEKMKQHSEEKKSMELFNCISSYTFDVILRCSMSYETNVQEEGASHPYLKAVGELGDLWVNRFYRPWLYNNFLYSLTSEGRKWKKYVDYVHKMSEEIISKRIQTLKSSKDGETRRYKDFLDILLTARDEEGKGLSFIEIRDEVDTFLFEGHDTTASSISWILYSLAQHPEHQIKCQQEVDEILQNRDSDELLWEDLAELKYLTLCIKEAMRLHSPVPFIARQLTKDMAINGVTLRAGSHIDLAICCLHHNPQIWQDPLIFNPNRFLPENFDKMDNFAYVPFSAGPRNCIGQHFAMHELKIATARILRRFSLTVDTTCVVRKKPTLVMRTDNGIRVFITARNVELKHLNRA